MQVTRCFRWFGKCGEWRRTGVAGLVGLAIFSLALSGTWAAEKAIPVRCETTQARITSIKTAKNHKTPDSKIPGTD